MKFQITGKNVSITPAMREKIEKKLTFLDKYLLIDDNVIANVACSLVHPKQKIEVTIPTKVGILRAEVLDDDLYAAIDLVIDKLEDQIRRQKTRLNKRHRENIANAFLTEEEMGDQDVLVRTKTLDADEMDLEEAIMRMEMLGHNFFVYRDDETGEVAVVYKRKAEGYGLIELSKQ
ncbi:MAG: ribosome hibernation-promoting factor, HPF/YfiA family [Erysipelotrichaceae bacterium]